MKLIKFTGNTAQYQRQKNTIKNTITPKQISFNVILERVNLLAGIISKN